MSRGVYIYNHGCGRCGDPAAPPPPAGPGDDLPPVLLYPGTTAHVHALFGHGAALDPVLADVVEGQRAAFADVDRSNVAGGGG